MSAPSDSPKHALRNLGWLLLSVAALTRIINAFTYKTRLGFDSIENVEYIEMLMQSWALPAPTAAWATSHPPLFYYLFALLGRTFAALGVSEWTLVAIPLVGGGASLLIAWLAASMVRKIYPGQETRALIAMALLLFLPVQIYLSAMVNEEVVAALFSTLALWLAIVPAPGKSDLSPSFRRVALIGFFGGLALLTKLSGVLVIAGISLAWLVRGLQSRNFRGAVGRVALLSLVSLSVGGWFYIRNYLLYGFIYPQDLELHAVMFEMPPGSRGLFDYFFIPLSTWTDPQLLNPQLIKSVWGSTYATLYFDGHRHFLTDSPTINQLGTFLLILGLLPLWAACVGISKVLTRPAKASSFTELPILLVTGLSIVGYVVFTLNNPWFVTLKAGYLLGLSIPFAWYSSESLARWVARPGRNRWLIGSWLVALWLTVTLAFTNGLIFEKIDGPGLPWQATIEDSEAFKQKL